MAIQEESNGTRPMKSAPGLEKVKASTKTKVDFGLKVVKMDVGMARHFLELGMAVPVGR